MLGSYLNPIALGLSSLQGNAQSLTVGVQLRAQPAVIIGLRPSPAAKPLPAKQNIPVSDAFQLTIPVRASYATISNQARLALKIDEGGIRYPATGSYYLRPTDASVYGYGEQAVVRIAFDGSAKGVLYLTGTPRWDAARNVLAFPDLDYTVETKNLLLKLARWADGDRFRDDLRARLVFDLTEQLNRARQIASSALNRNVDGVEFTDTLGSLNILGLYTDPKSGSFELLVGANGTLRAALLR